MNYSYEYLKRLEYIKVLPVDIILLILCNYNLDEFILCCDKLNINLNNKLTFIFHNYSYENYLKMNCDIKIIKDINILMKKMFYDHQLKYQTNKNIKAITYFNIHDHYHNDIQSDDIGEIYNNETIIKNLLWLHFNDDFNEKLNNTFNIKCFQNLVSVTFGYNFNQKIDALPDTIKYLTLGNNFDKIIKKLPSSLIKLTLSCKYQYKKQLKKYENRIQINYIGKILIMNFKHKTIKHPFKI